MIRHLGELIDAFKGHESQTRCFAHILNLIAKSVIRQFDVPRAKVNSLFDDEATTALRELAGNIDNEEQEMANSEDDSEDEEENMDDWVDERQALMMERLAELDESLQPVRVVLVKVRINFSNSTLRPLLF